MSGIVRIKDLNSASAIASGDYLPIDSTADGLRKIAVSDMVDDTLAESGVPADAKTVGDAIAEINTGMETLAETAAEAAAAQAEAAIEELVTNMSFPDGSIEKAKLAADVQTSLGKADGSMQRSVYDPLGYGQRAPSVDPYSFAQGRDTEMKNAIINDEVYEVSDVDNVKTQHSGIESAVSAALTRAERYAAGLLTNYSPFTILVVNELPATGADRTFYLIPKGNGKYEKWWYITDALGNKTWDRFGASSTVIVPSLPENADPDVDYILSDNGDYQYYKYINGTWCLIAGNTAEVIVYAAGVEIVGSGTSAPGAAFDLEECTGKYYLRTNLMVLYYCDGLAWTQGTALVASPSATKDYYVQDETGMWGHFRYIGGMFVQIGSASYTRTDIDRMLSEASARTDASLRNMSGQIDTIESKVDNLGNLVSDITETGSGIIVHYKDESTKPVQTKDTTVRVEDVDVMEGNAGLVITYSDGDTKELQISGGGGGAASGSASITRVTSAETQCVYGDACNIRYTFDAYDAVGDRVGAGTATWYVNNIRKVTTIANQLTTNSFDIGPYLNVGANNVKLSISVDVGGEAPIVRTKMWSVNAINMYLTWDYDDTTVNTADEIAIRWTPYGDLSKTTHFIIDGEEDEDLQTVTTRSGVQQYVTIDKLEHGSHTVELYCTATVNGVEITSDSVVHDMMFADENETDPIISCSVAGTTLIQYNTLRIPVAVYDPANLTTTAVLAVNGTEIATWANLDRSLHYWNYTPSDYGTKVLTITCGATTKTITLTVTQLDIDNEEVGGYAFRLKASDLAGNGALQAWNSNGVTASFSQNFDWANGGIKTEVDADGNISQYICIKAGTTMTLDYELFGNDAKINGKSVKIIFKTANCRDYDAVWLDCKSDGIGIRLGANGGTATSEQNTLESQYAEGIYTEFEFDIWSDNLASSAGNPLRYIQTYIDGVLSATKIYAANDNFTQTTKKQIVIGSADCDVYIYLVKVYETYLTRENHIVNFIADAPNAVEMVARYNRNDILAQNGEIDYTKLAAQNPNCRVHLLEITRMTTNKIKKDPVAGCSYQQIYGAGDGTHQIVAVSVTIGVQGTSSINYISSAANLDLRFNDGFTDENGTHTAGYAMSEGSIPINFFNLKVNVASCENINNMCLAEWYDTHQPYVTGARANVEGGRDCMEHHIGVVFIRDRHEDNENANYALFTDTDPNGDNYHMYAVCNMGNSKNNGGVFHDAENPLECCIETKDNNSAICMMTAQLTEEALDSEDYFEFRYPSSPTQAMKDAFIAFVNWAASRNPAAYTGDTLAVEETYEPYTFKGTSSWDANEQTQVLAGLTISDYAGTYTHDTWERRMALLLSECEDHLVMDSIVYHYVFIEQHAMVDNVTKNTFWGTDDLVHWHLCKNYDNDTADGNNNTGKLTIPFGAEGMDTISGGDVFNGKMNVYWQLVYGLYPARRRMWQNREAAGTWNADAYLEFATGWQNYLPERVYNQDYWYKYLRPYEQGADTQYIPMLEGGKKTHQREAFVRNNLTYMASQYTGTFCTSDSITVRAYTPGVSEDMTPEEAAIIEATVEAVPPVPKVRVKLYNKGYVVVEVASVMKRVKAEKNTWTEIDFSESSSAMNDTVVNIHGAGNVMAVGDMSPLYIKFCNFSKAKRLRSLQIGSVVTGYKNLGLESVGFENNPMLEELYIQNCPNSASTLDLSGCQALRTLDVRGSGFTGIDFAVGGLVETAYLCAPASLVMRSLYYLDNNSFSLESLANLTTLRLEDTPGISSLTIVNAAVNLARVRILGIDWQLSTTDVLNRILTLMGLDENDHNTAMSVLGGDVYVSGSIRNQEIANYEAAWPALDVDYNPSNLITQFKVTYVNADANSTVLYEKYVDQGSLPPDPYALGLISKPTLASTQQYTYEFGTTENGEYVSGSGWDALSTVIISERTITAVYTETVRTYTARWYARAGLLLKTETGIEYGSSAEYDGATPTWTDGEAANIYHLFVDWDKSTGFITGDIDVYAVWETSNIFPAVGTDMEDMTVTQIYGIGQAGIQDTFFEAGDHKELVLGYKPSFSNVDEIEIGEDVALTGIERDQFVSGGYYFDGEHAFKTNIKLFAEDSPAFTMAIDFQFNSASSGQTLISTHEGATSEGFRLYWNGSNPVIQWGDKSVVVGYAKQRDIVVIRHPKGSRYLYVYSSSSNSNTDKFSDDVIKTTLLRTNATQTNEPVTFGAVNYSSGFRYYGKGTLHGCKIWMADLGDDVASKIAVWPWEACQVEWWGAGKYYYADSNTPCKSSWIFNNLVGGLKGRGFWMNTTNTNVGGWEDSKIRDWLNDRFYRALPQVWRSAIKTVEIKAMVGNMSTEISAVNDHIYLHSQHELNGTTAAGYIEEVGATTDTIPWFTNNKQRVKFRGRIRKYEGDTGFTLYECDTDPAALYQTDISPGTIWIHTGNSSVGYIFVSQDELDQYGVTPDIAADSSFADGGWVIASNWWERSASVSNATNFMNVGTNGGAGSSGGNASTAYGVGPGFSF